ILGSDIALLFSRDSAGGGFDASRAAWCRAFGPPGPELRSPPTLLRQMLRDLAMVPAGLLDDESWTRVNVDWAIRLKENERGAERARAWLLACRDTALDDLAHFARRGRPAAIVRARLPVTDRDPLSLVPFVVGATALAERAVARGLVARSALLAEIERGYVHPPREALAAAPELYARDLCLMDILLTRAGSAAESSHS
ncbi:MAG TPA: hypothetical protein VMP03_05440, partial [Methylomirabilota bacterium]|nr:hypothetical protein [Methylomirabilota bacterium]